MLNAARVRVPRRGEAEWEGGDETPSMEGVVRSIFWLACIER